MSFKKTIFSWRWAGGRRRSWKTALCPLASFIHFLIWMRASIKLCNSSAHLVTKYIFSQVAGHNVKVFRYKTIWMEWKLKKKSVKNGWVENVKTTWILHDFRIIRNSRAFIRRKRVGEISNSAKKSCRLKFFWYFRLFCIHELPYARE